MLLIGPGRVITRDPQNPMLENGAVLTDGRIIKEVGDFQSLKARYPEAEVVSSSGWLIMPGFINAHHHIYSAFSRGLALKGYNPSGFLEILEGMWWRIDNSLNLDDSRASAAAVYLACIRNGVTTIFDHHASYKQTKGSLEVIAEEALRYGVRSCLCYEISDRNGRDEARKAIAENFRFARRAKEDPEHLAGLIGLHASFTLSDETLSEIAAENTEHFGYHVHVAEGILDQELCLKEHGERVVPRLLRYDILNERSVAGHCVHVTEEEKDMLAQSGVGIVHNPESNMGNAIGAPDILGLQERGITIGLGTDGFTSDMLESLKFANLLIKHREQDATVGGNIADLLFKNNPALAERVFPVKLGVLAPGAAADVIVLDYDEISPLNAANVNGHLLFGMNGLNVVTTVSDGIVRMKDREIQGIDAEKEVAKIRAQAADFARRVNA